MSDAQHAESVAILTEVRWLVENSESVIGLKLDGAPMAWPEVLRLYCPDLRAALTDGLPPTLHSGGQGKTPEKLGDQFDGKEAHDG